MTKAEFRCKMNFMEKTEITEEIKDGQCVLGIEFGSTRIKAVLVNSQFEPVASGSFEWENSLENGIWTYPLELIEKGLQSCYAGLKRDVKEKFGVVLKRLKSLGISAMMHGYIALDSNGSFLVPFRTWRNTSTGQASKELSKLFSFPVPERWTISHLYQAILNNEAHVADIRSLCTLASYIHFRLTGEKKIGTGDASGMFPIDSATGTYRKDFLEQFESLISARNFSWKTEQLLPTVLPAGKNAGTLTQSGARLLDPEGDLQDGIPLCPPEGDAGTGMAATNSVQKKTGNISAGTSVFAMVVLEKDLASSYPGIIDIVTTPDGLPVAMVHANNCTSEINSWIYFFEDVIETAGLKAQRGSLFDTLILKSLEAQKDCGNLLAYNYHSGETITGFSSGRPLFVRGENAQFNAANFMRVQMFTALGALRSGMDILFEREKAEIESMTGAGGYFKTEAGLKYMAAALHTPVSAMETAGEGGPWGMALLASYMADKSGMMLSEFLEKRVFGSCKKTVSHPEKELEESFSIFYERYKKGLAIERAAVESI